MIYYLTIITCSAGMVLSFVTGMVWFEYVASESYVGKGDVLIVFLSGFASALFFGVLYNLYQVFHLTRSLED
tara:strand:- start:205 stop:420 length:216 start_codon:yes stop_codon:yes gene_type:complete